MSFFVPKKKKKKRVQTDYCCDCKHFFYNKGCFPAIEVIGGMEFLCEHVKRISWRQRHDATRRDSFHS